MSQVRAIEPIPAYILAGGQSRRFGSDKARALVNGVPLVGRIAGELSSSGAVVTVVAEAEGKYADLGLPTIGDLRPGLGPMGGLQTALRHMPIPGWLLLVSCDMVGLDGRWIDALLAGQREGALAVAFRHDRWEPLLALYHANIGAEVDRRIDAGERGMQGFLDSFESVALPLPADWPALCHVNTPLELDEYLSE
jgi:molybdenum cofactor guanylyltransferase